MELWSNSIADLGMRNADCGLQIEVSDLQLTFSIRNPKFPSLQHSNTLNTLSAKYQHYGMFEAIRVK